MHEPEWFAGEASGALDQRLLTVSELTELIKELLETAFPSVWVSGEVSNFARPRSGHCYLTLKDEGAQLPAVIWRSTAGRVRFEISDGLEVVCRGRIGVYPPHGKYQLVISEIQPKGVGALELALRQLRDKLAKEGLFDPARKRPLPPLVRRIALVTSPTGAAIRDFLEVLRRRWKGADVLVVPVRVQGEGAAEEIAAAIDLVNRLATPPDCLVLARGGGSLEDLWAFNEEVVCRAIFRSRVPVVSAVGHEIDVTLSDLVADVRALTPSEAAERVVPDAQQMAQRIGQYGQRMAAALRAMAAAARSRWERVADHRAFRRPCERTQQLARQLDELEGRATRALRNRLQWVAQQTASIGARLDSLSPLAVLRRGFSLTERAADGQLVRSADQLSPGEQLRTKFYQGQALSRVERLDPRARPSAGPSSQE
ncbi:MAG TPA: exodeoxyribonuclease VII large subunit [Planctomycetaceae bacterium]|nr:exodeoxyribonuclease VII large subunit [Planctomycetaceae bacterium]